MRTFLVYLFLLSLAATPLNATTTSYPIEYTLEVLKNSSKVKLTNEKTKNTEECSFDSEMKKSMLGLLKIGKDGTIELSGDHVGGMYGLQIKGAEKTNIILRNFTIDRLDGEVAQLETFGNSIIRETGSFEADLLRVRDGKFSLSGKDYRVRMFSILKDGVFNALNDLRLHIFGRYLNNGKIIAQDNMEVELGKDTNLGKMYANHLTVKIKDAVNTIANIQKSQFEYNTFSSNHTGLSTYFDNLHKTTSWRAANASSHIKAKWRRYDYTKIAAKDQEIAQLVVGEDKGKGWIIPFFGHYEIFEDDHLNKFGYLSNFHFSVDREKYEIVVIVNGEEFKFNSVENAFQFAKCIIGGLTAQDSAELRKIAGRFQKAGQMGSKHLANKDYKYKYKSEKEPEINALMQNLVLQKFLNSNGMANKLESETGKMTLIEGTNWGGGSNPDLIWGQKFTGRTFEEHDFLKKGTMRYGQNKLGEMLMFARTKIREKGMCPLRVEPIELTCKYKKNVKAKAKAKAGVRAKTTIRADEANYVPSTSRSGWNYKIEDSLRNLFPGLQKPTITPDGTNKTLLIKFDNALDAQVVQKYFKDKSGNDMFLKDQISSTTYSIGGIDNIDSFFKLLKLDSSFIKRYMSAKKFT